MSLVFSLFLVDCHSIYKTDQRSIWIDHWFWILRHHNGPEEANTFHKTVRVELDLSSEDYTFENLMDNWTFDEKNLTLERYHTMETRARLLMVRLHRHKTSDFLIIAIQFTSYGDGTWEHSKERVCISRITYLDEESEITCKEFYGKNIGTSASFEEVHVQIKTHRVFNHLISTLSICHQPPLKAASMTALSPPPRVEAESPYDLLELNQSLSAHGQQQGNNLNATDTIENETS